jgi:hypothetical protein
MGKGFACTPLGMYDATGVLLALLPLTIGGGCEPREGILVGIDSLAGGGVRPVVTGAEGGG